MTKETMIWQTLTMIVAGMVANKTLPETKELFVDKVVSDAMCIIDYNKEDIIEVLKSRDCIEFSEIMCLLSK